MQDKLNDAWLEILDFCKDVISEPTYSSILKRLVPVSLEGNIFTLKALNNTFKNVVETRCLNEITEATQIVFGNEYQVKIIAPLEDTSVPVEMVKAQTNYKSSNLIPKFTFDTFIRGNSNDLAVATSIAVADAPGETTYNPLFLYGESGLGKTHLMHSIGNRILSKNPMTKVLYCSTETFVNELIQAIQLNKNQDFRDKYREVDILLIDDIQFITGNEAMQVEFFHTFNTLLSAGKQIVITSDQKPHDIKILEDRIRSRIASGLPVDIKPPDFETRAAILDSRAILDKIKISKDVTKYIAKAIASNIRELVGAFNKVVAYSKLSNREITLQLAEDAIKELIHDSVKKSVNIDYITNAVAVYFNISYADMLSKKRTADVALARQVAMYMSRKLLDISLPKIGDFFGKRDHTTVIHACNKITDELDKDAKFRNVLIQLEKQITG